jgi:RNA polymerase sigma-70 factor, ECF subfamily
MHSPVPYVSPTGPADLDLVQLAANGDATAEELLFRRHVVRVHRLATRIAGDADLAADLTQEVFIRVFSRLKLYRGDSAFTTWLHRVAVTTCLNAMRRVRRVRATERPLSVTLDARNVPAPDDFVVQQALSEAIDRLPLTHRLPLVMYALEGFSHKEIAAALGLTDGTSRRRVSEARQMLRDTLFPLSRELDR